MAVNNIKFLSEIETPGGQVLTQADMDEIVDSVLVALGGQPVFGYVDEDNNIILTVELTDGTYSVKYEMEDGSTINIGELEVNTTSSGSTYTNQIPISTEADGTPYNGGQGWKTGCRLNSSGQEDTSAAYSTREVTGFIPVGINDTIFVKGIITTNQTGNYLVCYDENRAIVTYGTTGKAAFGANNFATFDGSIESFTIATYAGPLMNAEAQAKIKYFRLGADVIDNNSIITINEEITEESGGTSGYTNLADMTSADWMHGRIGSDGGTRTDTVLPIITNFIPVSQGDIVRVSGCSLKTKNLAGYNSSKAKVFCQTLQTNETYYTINEVSDTYTQITITTSAIAYMRFTCENPSDSTIAAVDEDIIITVN